MARILIVDDDPDITESMKVILESSRHAVATAKNGEEGLRQAQAAGYDLIILDVMMETMSKGFEVARALKSVPANAKTPILLLTAIKESTGLDFEKEAGDKEWLPVDAYLEKPMKPNDLLLKVESLLKKKP